jgi:uncharacterized membrane protein YciS (DUF1049 family)
MRLLRRSEPAAPEEGHVEQPRGERRILAKLVILLAIAAYAVAFVLENHKQVKVHFVLATARVSLIWLVLLSLAIGLFAGRLLPRLYGRRRRRRD